MPSSPSVITATLTGGAEAGLALIRQDGRMRTVEEHQAVVAGLLGLLPVEEVAVAAAAGRVLAEDLPARRLAVLACMDARLPIFQVLGLKTGDAHVIRNAGGVITEDVIRSLTISQHALGTREIVLVHHTECGLMTTDDVSFADTVERATGRRPPWAARAFTDVDDDVRESMRLVRESPYLLSHEVRGTVYDVSTGRLREVEDLSAPDRAQAGGGPLQQGSEPAS